VSRAWDTEELFASLFSDEEFVRANTALHVDLFRDRHSNAGVPLSTLFFGTTAFAADAVDGTWNLNVAKSKFSGTAPKSATRAYTESADGKEMSMHVTLAYDGRDPHLRAARVPRRRAWQRQKAITYPG
jgi:hypothetical protein